MPLLKGKFRPAINTARSRTTSEGERVRSSSFSEYSDTLKQLASGGVGCSNSFLTSQCSAFKVPSSPIIVGLVSPVKKTYPLLPSPILKQPLFHPSSLKQPLFHPSPRKTPTTPFSPRRPLSPHFIQPPLTCDPFPRKHEPVSLQEDDPSLPRPSRLETITTAPDHSSGSDGDYSENMSVASYQESEDETVSRKRKIHPVKIDKAVMTIADLIRIRVPKNPDNPLTKVWSDLKEKEERERQLNVAKEETKKERINQLIEEARVRGETLTQNDIDENELPPIEVEVDESGKIVINQESLEVKPNSQTDIQETIIEDEAEITFGRYEDHKVSGLSYSRRKQAKSTKWNDNENIRFYLALRKVGTDFDLMHKIMPEYTRDQLKRKFKREEKLRLSKVDMALNHSMKLDDRELEKKPPEPPKEKPKPKPRKPKKKADDLSITMRSGRSRQVSKRAQRRPRALSDSDEERTVKRGRKRGHRPLKIEDSEDLEMIAIIRDNSLDRKIVL